MTTTLVGPEEPQPSVSGDEGQAAMKRAGGSLFPAPSSSSSHHIDAIVDKQKSNLSTKIQLILQRESIHLSLPQSPHSTSGGDAQCEPAPHKLVSRFSQYVSFYNPRPPVHEYVSSLQDGISSLLTELQDGWLSPAQPSDPPEPSDPPNSSNPSGKNNALASKVGAARSPSAHAATQWRPRPPNGHASPPLSAPPSQPASARVQSAEPHPHDGVGGVDGTPQGPAPYSPATALSSLISQIQPEVFSNLAEIVQDVKRNSVQFYVHATEPGDAVYEEIKVTVFCLHIPGAASLPADQRSSTFFSRGTQVQCHTTNQKDLK